MPSVLINFKEKIVYKKLFKKIYSLKSNQTFYRFNRLAQLKR